MPVFHMIYVQSGIETRGLVYTKYVSAYIKCVRAFYSGLVPLDPHVDQADAPFAQQTAIFKIANQTCHQSITVIMAQFHWYNVSVHTPGRSLNLVFH